MTTLYATFLQYLKTGDTILDVGCGSGRDSLYFKKCGYKVTAFDASIEMVNRSTKLLGQKVIHSTFEDYHTVESFNGIWACASLLHVKRNKVSSVVQKLGATLKPAGVFYLSFKYGDGEFTTEGRYFNCYNEQTFRHFVNELPDLQLDTISKTRDVRPERTNEYWLNCYLRKQ